MRFKSKKVEGIQVFAVTGTNTVTLGIDATAAARKGLLGFAIERIDPKEKERYFMRGFKVFEELCPFPDKDTRAVTSEHPIQDFVWSDFTGKPGRDYEYVLHPVRGKPKRQERGKPVSVKVTTEALFTKGTHDIFFNRGVASSQAYAEKYRNLPPEKLEGDEREEALQWLSRDLDEALLKFIDQTKKGDQLLGCFYEFRYPKVVESLKAAVRRGVDVRLVLDGKANGSMSKGKKVESYPSVENRKLAKELKFPASRITWREARASCIQHNKFMVWLQGKVRRPRQVWTGSTNLSMSGFHGQTNVGHWVRDDYIAAQFAAYWKLLAKDPGGTKDDTPADVRKKNAALRASVAALGDVPATVDDIAAGTTALFSPRPGLDLLERYVDLVDEADSLACITLAFGINKTFKQRLVDNPPLGPVILMLLEKKDVGRANAKEPFVAINAKNNVYKAWGSYLKDPVYQWTRETNAKLMRLAKHISYVHSKFVLRDPLGEDPIVVTGSANFSEDSTTENDENMLLIRGDTRVADIYFTEFNRIFFHYYYRAVVESTRGTEDAQPAFLSFLETDPAVWLANYKPGKFKHKRLAALVGMQGFA